MECSSVNFWAIADTHLSFAKQKDMSRFGEKWLNHTERIANAWREQVSPEDVILIPGDISWAQSAGRILPDLAWLSMLPGQKVLLRGNHDHWWDGIGKARALAQPFGFHLLEGDSLELNGVVLCGAMGHVAPHDPYYKADAKKDRYTRELERLQKALEAGHKRRQSPHQPMILMMHYPPFTSDGKRTAYVDVISHYRPTVCLYGHLHHPHEWEIAQQGEFEGVEYALVAADYLNMIPHRVLTSPNGSG